jgi:hypothetical protein
MTDDVEQPDYFNKIVKILSDEKVDETMFNTLFGVINVYKKGKSVQSVVNKLTNEILTGSTDLYDSVDDALINADKCKTAFIISFLTHYKVFINENYFDQYIRSVEELYNGLRQIPDHFENIPEDKEQSLIFECIFSTEDILKIVKEKFVNHFKVDVNSIDIAPIRENTYTFIARSIKGTFSENSIKITEFISTLDIKLRDHVKLKSLISSLHKKRYLENKIMVEKFDPELKTLIRNSIGNLKITQFGNITINVTNNNINSNNTTNNITNINNNDNIIRRYLEQNPPSKNVQPSDYYKNFCDSNNEYVVNIRDFSKCLKQIGYKIKQNKTTYKRHWSL